VPTAATTRSPDIETLDRGIKRAMRWRMLRASTWSTAAGQPHQRRGEDRDDQRHERQ
jgi:hypothetical protein